MLKNYFLIAVRNLWKHKTFSIINIAGLSIGIACCVVLSLYIKDELSYEKHFDGARRIYRLTSTIIQESGTTVTFQRTSPPVIPTLAEEFPEVECATRVVTAPEVEQHLLRYGDKVFYEKKGYLVDSTFLDVFSYELQEGDRTTALDEPSTVIISHAIAQKIFHDRSALNESIIITSAQVADTFRITGVLKPYAGKSHLDADFYMCMNSGGLGRYINTLTTWTGQNMIFGYIKLKPSASAQDLQAKFPALMETYGGEEMKTIRCRKIIGLQSLTDVHLYSNHFDLDFDITTNGNIYYVYVLGAVALFILLIACINFVNLTTAKASQRAGEVGVRKTMGANRSQLIKQFLGESMAIVTISMVFSMGLIQLALPFFNILTERSITLDGENWLYLTLFLLTISLFAGVLAGSYPAFFLSSFQPAQVLKDKRLSGGSSHWLRKGLVVIQFVISITLIASIAIIQQQLSFMQSQSLGFNADYKVIIPLRTDESKAAYQAFKNRVKQIAGVTDITASTSLPSTPLQRDFSLYTEGTSVADARMHYIIMPEENYFTFFDIPVVAGRNFQRESDAYDFDNRKGVNKIIVNQASLRALGIAQEEAIGKNVYVDRKGIPLRHEIIGVVADFHQASLHAKINPIAFVLPPTSDNYVYATVSLSGSHYESIIRQVQDTWKAIVPVTPFEHTFLSDNVARQYQADKQISAIMTIFTSIAIVISCLGLYGLSVYMAERRVKEIGIRKVLGASVPSLVGMLSKDFIKLVAIAFLISAPLGYYTMTQWLQNFAYKIEPSVLTFLLSGGVSFMIAWLTVSFESIRAATVNPVKSLRNE